MSLFDKEIKGFSGEYRFLSNFYPCKIDLNDLPFPSVEHAYVALKHHHMTVVEYNNIVKMTAGQAKRYGRTFQIRKDWDSVKTAAMLGLLRQKFSSANPELMALLLATDDAYIEETNTWGDTFWGICDGKGLNVLGTLLMNIREELRHG